MKAVVLDVDCDGITLRVTSAGVGPPVVMLHGFPQNAHAFRYQIDALSDAGYQVVAPNLRGYPGSSKPPNVDDYTLDKLVGDVVSLLDKFAFAEVTLVGHDWGGVVAFAVASRHPTRVKQLVILNAAHPELYRAGLWKLSQFWRSWYVLFFQLPELPELMVQSRDYFEDIMQSEAPHAFSDGELEVYIHATREPGVARAAINYYRASRSHPVSAPTPIGCPTLVLWGQNDEALSEHLLTGLSTYCPLLTVVKIPGASHWLAEDRPALVVEHLLSVLNTPV